MGRRNVSTQQVTPPRDRAPRVLVVFVTTFLAVSSVARAQDRALSSQVRHWLEATCGVGDESLEPVSLRQLGVDAVPLFIESFATGPTEDTIDRIRVAAAARFERIGRLLADGSSFGLNAADLDVLRQARRDAYVEQAVDDLNFTYGDAALRAVRILGGTVGRQFLREVAGDDASPHTETARAMLMEIRP